MRNRGKHILICNGIRFIREVFMDYSFKDLKKKTVINVADGSKIGKISDVTVSFPNNCLVSFTVSPSFCLSAQDKQEISPCDIDKIGEDAILVKKHIKVRDACDDEE